MIPAQRTLFAEVVVFTGFSKLNVSETPAFPIQGLPSTCFGAMTLLLETGHEMDQFDFVFRRILFADDTRVYSRNAEDAAKEEGCGQILCSSNTVCSTGMYVI